jgi:signal transduction histidine kinase
VWQNTLVSRTKRTYNLSEQAVRLVRELVTDYRVAPTQDAAVELAIDELARRVREAQEATLWARAAEDPDFRREAEEVAAAFDAADRETWPA